MKYLKNYQLKLWLWYVNIFIKNIRQKTSYRKRGGLIGKSQVYFSSGHLHSLYEESLYEKSQQFENTVCIHIGARIEKCRKVSAGERAWWITPCTTRRCTENRSKSLQYVCNYLYIHVFDGDGYTAITRTYSFGARPKRRRDNISPVITIITIIIVIQYYYKHAVEKPLLCASTASATVKVPRKLCVYRAESA